MPSNSRYSVWIESPGEIVIKQSEIPSPAASQVLVKSSCSAISAGTEMLAYNGVLPQNIALDTSISGLSQPISYPMKYGYSLVGEVVDIGHGVDRSLIGKRVFVFQPHESHFLAFAKELIIIPDDVHTEDAVFLANMETAVSLVLDGRPLLGERVAVFGLGIVGLLLTALLSSMKLARIVGIDPVLKRRRVAFARNCVMVDSPEHTENIRKDDLHDYDLVYETSGNPDALRNAISMTGYHGRLIIGSWYGNKEVNIDLGSHFHRSKMSIYASQVSAIDPVLTGRWTKERRIQTAFSMLKEIKPRSYITHQHGIWDARAAYAQIGRNPEHIQSIITY